MDFENFGRLGFSFLKKNRNGHSESGLCIALKRGDFAGDGLAAAASSMAAVLPSPSVIQSYELQVAS